MRKKLLIASAAAAAVLPLWAQAQQSNVTIYGRMNTSFERIKVTGTPSHNELIDNESRIGFRGTEDLGGGLKAIFQIENRINSDGSGTPGFGGRDTWVGLSGGYGTLKMGRITSPLLLATTDYIGMHNHETGTSEDALMWFPASGSYRNPGSITYKSPTFGGGFTFEAQHSLMTDGVLGKHDDLVLSYGNGPLYAAIGFGTANNSPLTGLQVPAAASRSEDSWAIAALYDFKTVVVGGMYERNKVEDIGNRNYWRLAAMIPVGNHEFHANFGRAGDVGSVASSGANQYTLAYNYNLSKRTKLYGFYTKIDNDAAAAYGFFGGTAAAGGLGAIPAGADASSLALGMRHNF